jgi:hypothetical protein
MKIPIADTLMYNHRVSGLNRSNVCGGGCSSSSDEKHHDHQVIVVIVVFLVRATTIRGISRVALLVLVLQLVDIIVLTAGLESCVIGSSWLKARRRRTIATTSQLVDGGAGWTHKTQSSAEPQLFDHKIMFRFYR